MANRKRFTSLIIITLITYLSIELACFIAIKTTFTQANLPQFFSDPADTAIFPFAYADANNKWGVWHFDKPVRVRYKCLTVGCDPNSAGACDIERSRKSSDSNRCIVLGDSFMEGFGIDPQNRVSNLLEKMTGRPMMNFACADMGSTQEYLVYKELASSFSHNEVLLGILPANDFFNDNIEFDSIQTPRRYKPYWTGSFPHMEISYFVDDISKSQFTPAAYKSYKSTGAYRIRHFLENTTCWFNLFYYISKRKRAGDFVQSKTTGNQYSGYYDFSEDDLSRLKQSLLGIKKIAGDRKVTVFTIPVREDFDRYKREKKVPLLVAHLRTFCDSSGVNYFDLLSESSDKDLRIYDSFYFDCDIHWNEEGNRWAAALVAKQILH